MIQDRNTVYEAWLSFQKRVGGLKRPTSGGEYLELRALLDDLTNRFDCSTEPYGSLFDLIAGYMLEWEQQNEPEEDDALPHEMLAFYMEQQGVSQYQLAKEGLVDQPNLSKILKGERGISKSLAKKLAERFHTSAEVFL